MGGGWVGEQVIWKSVGLGKESPGITSRGKQMRRIAIHVILLRAVIKHHNIATYICNNHIRVRTDPYCGSDQ